MRNIYAALDIGTYSLKFVISEIKNNNLKILFREATKLDIDINDNYLLNNLAKNIEAIILKARQSTNLLIDKIYVSYSAKNYHMSFFEKTYYFNSTNTIIDKKTLQQIENNLFNENTMSELRLADVFVEKYYLNDDSDYYTNPINKVASYVTVTGNAFYSDAHQYAMYQKIFQKLKVKCLKLLPSAICHSFASVNYLKPNVSYLAIDFGHSSINLNYFSDSTLQISEVINKGAKELDISIAKITHQNLKWANRWKNTYNNFNSLKDICQNEFVASEIKVAENKILKVMSTDIQLQMKKTFMQLLSLINDFIKNNNIQPDVFIWTGGGSSLKKFEAIIKGYFPKMQQQIYSPKEMGLGYDSIFANCIGNIQYQKILDQKLNIKTQNSLALINNLFFTKKIAKMLVNKQKQLIIK